MVSTDSPRPSTLRVPAPSSSQQSGTAARSGPQDGHRQLTQRFVWLLGGSVLGLVALLVAVSFAGRTDQEGPQGGAAASVPAVFAEDQELGRISDRSVVQIRAFGRSGICWTGSGVVYPDAETIITNHHVAVDDGSCGLSRLEVWVSVAGDTAVAPAYIAQVAAELEEQDLAILKLSPLGDEVPPLEPVQAAETISIGLELIMLGFPAVGGDSLTVSRGIVSGFFREDDLEWIKTDAAAASGNSGGPALDLQRRLIGVMSHQRLLFDDSNCQNGDDQDDCFTNLDSLNLVVPLSQIDRLLQGLR